jgi:blue copper oxidase
MAAIIAGYIGDNMLVNGAPYPVATTARGWLRLRILNCSNARTYRLKASDDRALYVVAGDGSLLDEPVEVKELAIYSGERFEVMVDTRDGKPFDLLTLPVDQLGMNLPPFHQPLVLLTISPDGAETNGTLPDKLISLPPLDSDLPPSSQDLVMGMRLDDQGMKEFSKAGLMDMNMSGKLDAKVVENVNKLIVDGPALSLSEQLGANTINASSFSMTEIPFSAPPRKNLRWTISEGDDKMLHPVHIHGCQFRILSLNGAPPAPHLTGWKDMAPISNGGVCEIQVRFDELAPESAPYMAHCHNLEHEDSGMMTQFTVA